MELYHFKLMKKDAYYFPHFCNARNDSKIIKIRRVLGLEGYAIYFMLLEVLREQTDFKYPISGIEDLSYEWHISKEKIASVIKDFDLFEIIDIHFFSSKLIYYLQPYIEKSERAIKANEIRWNRVKKLTNDIQMDIHLESKSILNKSPIKVKESKVNNSKIYKSKEEKFDFKKSLISLNVDEKLVNDFILVRKNKKATNSETAFNKLKEQFNISGLTANECVRIAVEKSWAGFEVEWLKNVGIKSKPTTNVPEKSKYNDPKNLIFG